MNLISISHVITNRREVEKCEMCVKFLKQNKNTHIQMMTFA